MELQRADARRPHRQVDVQAKVFRRPAALRLLAPSTKGNCRSQPRVTFAVSAAQRSIPLQSRVEAAPPRDSFFSLQLHAPCP